MSESLTRGSYETVLAAHAVAIDSDLKAIELRIATASTPESRTRLEITRDILLSGLFDGEFYLQQNPDVRAAAMDPLEHYISSGDAEGRWPNPFFSPIEYRELNAGLPAMPALAHYVRQGERAGLKASLRFDPRAYLEANPGLATYVDRPLFHFLRIGQHSDLSTWPILPNDGQLPGGPRRRTAAILVPGSPNAAFYSQIAALSSALHRIPWSRWTVRLYAFFGRHVDESHELSWRHWQRYLQDVTIMRMPADVYAAKGNWAQVDATMECAPRDADVIISMDADTLPVAGFEDVLDRVADQNLIAGVMAYRPMPPALTPQQDWRRIAKALIGQGLTFDFEHSLVSKSEPEEHRYCPFCVNGGVVFYSRESFDTFAPLYLALRHRLMDRMSWTDFSGQVATTLAITEARLRTWALPMRYNFPNDPLAVELHPQEVDKVVIYHYLRTTMFDRHKIFASPIAFSEFLNLSLEKPDSDFQNAVRNVFSSTYPFVP